MQDSSERAFFTKAKWLLIALSLITAIIIVGAIIFATRGSGSSSAAAQSASATSSSVDQSNVTAPITSPAIPEVTSSPSKIPEVTEPAVPVVPPKPVEAANGGSKQEPGMTDWQPGVKAFLAAYTANTTNKDEWLAGLKPFASPSLYESLKTVDLENRPQGEFGAVTLREDNGVGTIIFDVSYKGIGYSWSGTAQYSAPEWLVYTLDGKLSK